MSDKCKDCKSKGTCKSEKECIYWEFNYGKVKNIIPIISGKGGVGKSSITAMLGTFLKRNGYKVGILDADVTGPSIPRIFGLQNMKAYAKDDVNNPNKKMFLPVATQNGVLTMSINYLVENENDPVIWRGSLITGFIKQIFEETEWGEIDYLLIDMPPGTGDTALTIMQNVQVKGNIEVATPQPLVSMIVKKLMKMEEKIGVKSLGIIENMSHIICENCNTKQKLYGDVDEQIKYLEGKLLAQLPLDNKLYESIENLNFEEYILSSKVYTEIFESVIDKLTQE